MRLDVPSIKCGKALVIRHVGQVQETALCASCNQKLIGACAVGIRLILPAHGASTMPQPTPIP